MLIFSMFFTFHFLIFLGHLTTLLVAHLICQGWSVRRAAKTALWEANFAKSVSFFVKSNRTVATLFGARARAGKARRASEYASRLLTPLLSSVH